MATKKIELSGISFEDVEVDGRKVILVSTAKGSTTTLATARKGALAFILGNVKNRATYIFENHAVYNGGKTSVSLIGSAGDYKASGSSRSAVVTINASQVDNEISLTGNANANVIIAGDENSTLYGGKGNDTLIGGDGEDVIYGFENGDTLKIDIDNFNLANMKATVNKKGDSVTLKIGAGSVTFKNFTAKTFHINENTYQIASSGKNKWTFAKTD